MPYYINGPYGISGAASLNLNGYSCVSLNTASTYSGGTTLNNGTLNINNASAIGTGPLNISRRQHNNRQYQRVADRADDRQCAELELRLHLRRHERPEPGHGRRASDRYAHDHVPAIPGGTGMLTVGGPISGVGFGITKDGPGTMVLAGANTYTGNTTVTAGTLIIGPGGSIDSSANPDSYISVASGASFNMNGGNVTLGNNVFTSANNNNLMMLANDSAFYIASGTLTCSNGATSWNQIRGNFTQTGGSLVTNGFSMADGNSTTATYYLGRNRHDVGGARRLGQLARRRPRRSQLLCERIRVANRHRGCKPG